MDKTDITHLAILISHLAIKAGIKPEYLAEVMPPSNSEQTLKAIEFWNAMLAAKKVHKPTDYAALK